MDMKYRFIILLMMFMLITACSINSGESIDQAEKHLLQGDYRSAIITLKTILQDNPDDKNARILLAKVYLPLGDGASAEKELNKARQLGAQESRVIELLGWAYLLQGDAERALVLTEIKGQVPSDRSAIHVLRGEAYRVKGELTQAQASFDKAVEIESQSLRGLMGQIKVSLAQNEQKIAESRMQRLLELHPDSAEVWSLRGDMQSVKQQNADAEKSYLKSLELLAEKQMTRAGFNARLALAQSQVALGKMDDALKNVSILSQAQPKHPLVKYMRAIIAYEQKDYTLAHENLVQVLKVVQNHTPSNLLLGATQFAMGNYEQAREQLVRVINDVPTYIQARKMLAAVYLKLRQPEVAFDVLQDSSEEYADDAQLLAMMGRVALFSGDLEKGIRFYRKAVQNEPGQSAIRAELARLYLNQGEFDSAINELSKIEGERKSQARKLMIYAYMKDQDYARAMELAVQLQKETPDDLAVLVIKGAIELNRGMRPKAKQYFLDARAMEKGFVPALLNLARMELEDGSLTAAEAWYDEILITDDKNLSALFGMAQISEKRGKAIQARKWIEKAADENPKALAPVMILANYYINSRQYQRAEQVIGKATEYQPSNTDLIKLEAKLLLAQGKGNEVIVRLERLVALQPGNTANYLQLAKVYENNNNLDAARKALLKAQKQSGASLPLNVALSQIETRLGHFEDAQRYINQLKRDKKGQALAYGLSGDVYMQQKNYKAAEKAYLKGAQLNDEHAFVAKQAVAQMKAGRKTQAQATIKAWLDDHNSDIKAKMTFALLYMQIEAVKPAITLYEEVLKKQPNNAVALNNLAWLYHQAGDARAFKTAEQAYKLAPNSVGVLDTFGWLLLAQGDAGKATILLREAVKRAPNNLEIRLHLVEALINQGGGEDEARSLLAGIVESKESKVSKQVQKLIEKLTE